MADTQQAHANGMENGVAVEDEEEDLSKLRPADIDADVKEMERRKRVEMIMNSKLFREELERIIEMQMKDGNGSAGLLQQISDMMGIQAGKFHTTHMFRGLNCVTPINDIRGVENMAYAKGEKILRCKLASVFRLMDLYGWAQGIHNQITVRLSQDEEHFLVNPFGMLYNEITASSLVKVDMQGNVVEPGTTNFSVNTQVFLLHSSIHANRPDIKCIIHIHTPSVLAVSSLKCGLLPLCQEALVIGEVSQHPFMSGIFEPEQREKIIRNLGPTNKILLLNNHGALCCGETVEEAFYNVYNTVLACETQIKLMPVGVDNFVLVSDETRKQVYDAAHRAPEVDGDKKVKHFRVGELEFEALIRMLDNAGFRTGYIYRHPLVKGEVPKPKNDVEVPPAVSSLGYLIEEEKLYKQGNWKKYVDGRNRLDRTKWLNSPNVYKKVEILETGTSDPKKITKWVDQNSEEWVAENSPTHSSTPVKIDPALQFVPKNTNPKEFKKLQQQIKENRMADKITSGPQSHILEGVTWEEAKKLQDANITQTGDQVILVGAASKGIIQRNFQHNALVYKTPYAKNPFDSISDKEIEDYKKLIERKQRGDTDYEESQSESEALSSRQEALRHIKSPLMSPQSATSETEEESRDEPRVLRIETKTAPQPIQAEVVLSDADFDATDARVERSQSARYPKAEKPESVTIVNSFRKSWSLKRDKEKNKDVDNPDVCGSQEPGPSASQTSLIDETEKEPIRACVARITNLKQRVVFVETRGKAIRRIGGGIYKSVSDPCDLSRLSETDFLYESDRYDEDASSTSIFDDCSVEPVTAGDSATVDLRRRLSLRKKLIYSAKMRFLGLDAGKKVQRKGSPGSRMCALISEIRDKINEIMSPGKRENVSEVMTDSILSPMRRKPLQRSILTDCSRGRDDGDLRRRSRRVEFDIGDREEYRVEKGRTEDEQVAKEKAKAEEAKEIVDWLIEDLIDRTEEYADKKRYTIANESEFPLTKEESTKAENVEKVMDTVDLVEECEDEKTYTIAKESDLDKFLPTEEESTKAKNVEEVMDTVDLVEECEDEKTYTIAKESEFPLTKEESTKAKNVEGVMDTVDLVEECEDEKTYTIAKESDLDKFLPTEEESTKAKNVEEVMDTVDLVEECEDEKTYTIAKESDLDKFLPTKEESTKTENVEKVMDTVDLVEECEEGKTYTISTESDPDKFPLTKEDCKNVEIMVEPQMMDTVEQAEEDEDEKTYTVSKESDLPIKEESTKEVEETGEIVEWVIQDLFRRLYEWEDRKAQIISESDPDECTKTEDVEKMVQPQVMDQAEEYEDEQVAKAEEAKEIVDRLIEDLVDLTVEYANKRTYTIAKESDLDEFLATKEGSTKEAEEIGEIVEWVIQDLFRRLDKWEDQKAQIISESDPDKLSSTKAEDMVPEEVGETIDEKTYTIARESDQLTSLISSTGRDRYYEKTILKPINSETILEVRECKKAETEDRDKAKQSDAVIESTQAGSRSVSSLPHIDKSPAKESGEVPESPHLNKSSETDLSFIKSGSCRTSTDIDTSVAFRTETESSDRRESQERETSAKETTTAAEEVATKPKLPGIPESPEFLNVDTEDAPVTSSSKNSSPGLAEAEGQGPGAEKAEPKEEKRGDDENEDAQKKKKKKKKRGKKTSTMITIKKEVAEKGSEEPIVSEIKLTIKNSNGSYQREKYEVEVQDESNTSGEMSRTASSLGGESADGNPNFEIVVDDNCICPAKKNLENLQGEVSDTIGKLHGIEDYFECEIKKTIGKETRKGVVQSSRVEKRGITFKYGEPGEVLTGEENEVQPPEDERSKGSTEGGEVGNLEGGGSKMAEVEKPPVEEVKMPKIKNNLEVGNAVKNIVEFILNDGESQKKSAAEKSTPAETSEEQEDEEGDVDVGRQKRKNPAFNVLIATPDAKKIYINYDEAAASSFTLVGEPEEDMKNGADLGSWYVNADDVNEDFEESPEWFSADSPGKTSENTSFDSAVSHLEGCPCEECGNDIPICRKSSGGSLTIIEEVDETEYELFES